MKVFNLNSYINFHLSLLFVALCSFSVHAQRLSLEDAIELGLENNLSLKILQKDKDITAINTGKGAAGMLPSVTANGNTSYSINNANQVYLDGRENSIYGGSNFQIGGEVRMDWTLFDGRAMYIRKDQLDLENDLAGIQLKNEILNLSSDISQSYENLVLLKKQLSIINENILYIQDLLQLSESKLLIGSASKLDVLQAKTDLNEYQNTKDLILMQYDLVSIQLNQLLNQDVQSDIEVDTSFIEKTQMPGYDVWADNAITSNPTIEMGNTRKEIALRSIDIAKSGKMPQVDFNAGVDYSYLNSSTGFLVSNVNYGPYIGLTAKYNIYDGNRVQREIETAEIIADQSQLDIEVQEQEIEKDLFFQYKSYQYYRQQLQREKDNIKLVEESFALADQLYRNGRITQFELRQVLIQKLSIDQRVVQAEFELAVAYIQLMRTSGQNWF